MHYKTQFRKVITPDRANPTVSIVEDLEEWRDFLNEMRKAKIRVCHTVVITVIDPNLQQIVNYLVSALTINLYLLSGLS